MKQLKMYRDASIPAGEIKLPEGYSFSRYQGTVEDAEAWCECCRNGLIADDAGLESFQKNILNEKGICPERDVFFLDADGKHVGTVTAYVRPDGFGGVHMVGIRTEYRGKGLCSPMLKKAVLHLQELGVKTLRLTTDDWRKAAIRAYLNEDFRPVEYDIGMQDRWENVLEDIDVESAEMVYEDATPFHAIQRRSKARKIRFGVIGCGRGKTMMNYCVKSGHAELVAVCEKSPRLLEEAKKSYGESVTFYSDFEEFLKHDMDCVVLANYANEHAPFAIRCMEAGKNVLSEVLPVQTMKEAVELIEAVERTGKIYAYAENYCFMPAPRKIRKLYREGLLGEFEYGEGEYMHNCESIWHRITGGDPDHWRNRMTAFFYCTHSFGPLVHITGLRPTSVIGLEGAFNGRMYRMGAKAGPFGVEMVTMENGGIVKSLHGVGPSKDSIWYSVYGSKGRLESAREDAEMGDVSRLYSNLDVEEGGNTKNVKEICTDDALSEDAKGFGHGGSDYYVMYNMVEKLRGNRNADTVDVYEAVDMFLPGLLAYRSALNGGAPERIPDLRDPAERDLYQNDTKCTDPKVAGEQLLPSYSKGDPEIPQEIYDYVASIPESEENTAATRRKLQEKG